MSEKTPHTTETAPPPETAWADFSEKLKDPSLKLMDMLKETGIEGRTPEARLTLLEATTVEDYQAVVDLLHRKVAPDINPEPAETAISILDPRTGEASATTAQPEERQAIMESAHFGIQAVIEKYRTEGGSLQDTLTRCANLAAFGIVLAHPYEDGNGRTARTLGVLIQNGFHENDPESVDDLTVLSENRPESGGYRVFSYVPGGDWRGGAANHNPTAFLAMVASLHAPLDGAAYKEAARGQFTTPIA